MTARSNIKRALKVGALAAGLIAGTTYSASAQEVVTYVDFFWQNQTQASCAAHGEDAVNQAIDAFGIQDAEMRTDVWNILANTPDFNFWVFCIGDGGGENVVDPAGQRILTIILVASGRSDINENLRDYLSECMHGTCPVGEVAAETIDWATNALSYRDRGGVIELYCPSLGNGSFRPVWGTDVYTGDSSICTAAVHAGVITMGGGVVRIEMLPGEPSYTGTQRNGVSTSNWGNYTSSFRFATGGKG